ncbi:hypothetical protein BN59_03258 [Legionella massiliensis]|uniref:Uncharacterized protein n=1 Tax=Legionella massiliensis TaxID=1034943 RepID=A0A078L4W4_9GAMM|nr:hypothetical protein [Legionella massiliensis]CDZ78943.1 hypothetical protein BN59_03258 [Legionella massiliensis]CEE14681.1 hypothetical protein BN1094_03258 [Legionella massiliensis]
MTRIMLWLMLTITSLGYCKNTSDLYQVGTFAAVLNGAVNGTEHLLSVAIMLNLYKGMTG